jgi:BolA protein
LTVVSAAFEGQAWVARHRMVYDLLSEELAGQVHALALRTLTPAEDA